MDDAGRTAFRLDAGERRRLDFELACERWGAYRIGLVDVRIRSAFGLRSTTAQIDAAMPLRPILAGRSCGGWCRRTTRPRSRVARCLGPRGGDRVRRHSPFRARRSRPSGELAGQRPPRADVRQREPSGARERRVPFLDSFAEARGPDEGTIDQAVRAASSLADAYLERRNRVVSLASAAFSAGSPSDGHAPAVPHRRRSIETELARSYMSTSVDVIPRRVLPPQSLVIALTPLLDQRTIMALLDLRARGFDLAVVDVSPVPSRRRAAPQWRRPRLAALDDVAAGAAPPVRTGWSSRGRVVARPIAARRHRGGDGIQTTHALGLRLALIATSVVAAVAVVLAPLLATGSLRGDEQFIAVVALAALILLPLLGVVRLLPWAVALLAAASPDGIGAWRHRQHRHRALCGDGSARRRGRVGCGEPGAAHPDRAPAGPQARASASRSRRSQPVLSPRPSSPRRRSAIPAGLATLALGLLATVSLLGLVAGLVARR